MKSYLVSFKLNDQIQYEGISALLRSYPKWARIVENVWIVCSEEKLVDIREKASNAIKGNGIVMVMDISGDAWGTYAVSKEVTDWMKTNI